MPPQQLRTDCLQMVHRSHSKHYSWYTHCNWRY